VKTLHPGVHGGILAMRNNPAHMDAIGKHNIAPIDVVRRAGRDRLGQAGAGLLL
jgi:AICAR transformylase/IMP cyclohydrolase PurH